MSQAPVVRTIRYTPEMLTQAERIRTHLEATNPGVRVSEADVLRYALARTAEAVEPRS